MGNGLYTDAVTSRSIVTADKRLKAPIVVVKVEDTPQNVRDRRRLANVERAPYVLVGLTGVSKAAAEPIATRIR